MATAWSATSETAAAAAAAETRTERDGRASRPSRRHDASARSGDGVSAAASRRIDLRRAALSDELELQVRLALQELRSACAQEQETQILWPRDRDLAYLSSILKMPLAHKVVSLLGGGRSRLSVHTRSRQVQDFLALAPDARVQFVFHINTEEAALRWERGEASPSQRLKAARQLGAAGWKVKICIGPVRLFPDWREEYLDIAEQVAGSGFRGADLSFARGGAGGGGCAGGADAQAAAEILSQRHQRQIQRLIASRLELEPECDAHGFGALLR